MSIALKTQALKNPKKYITVDPDRTAYKNRDRCKNRDSKGNEVDLMMIYESLSFHIEHLSYSWSIITYWILIENSIRVF